MVGRTLVSYKVKEKSLLLRPVTLQKGVSCREPPSDSGGHGIHGNRVETSSLELDTSQICIRPSEVTRTGVTDYPLRQPLP